MKWPENGAHHESFEGVAPFNQHGYVHTNVTHKRKSGQPVQYVAVRSVRFPDGEERSLLGGTEK
eukprot:15404606-Alexandrium_andersonii.AAC.1